MILCPISRERGQRNTLFRSLLHQKHGLSPTYQMHNSTPPATPLAGGIDKVVSVGVSFSTLTKISLSFDDGVCQAIFVTFFDS